MKIIVDQITVEDLIQRLTASIGEENKKLLPKKDEENYLTRKEVAALLKISLVTLNEWGKEKKGYLKPRKIGSRVRFLKSEIDELMKQGTHHKYGRR